MVAVRWYLTYPLSYRQVGDMLRDRGCRWLRARHALGSALCAGVGEALEKPVALSWRVDETYIKVGGGWTYPGRGKDAG